MCLDPTRPGLPIAFDRICMHEFVLSAARQRKQGASALDVAKALIVLLQEAVDGAEKPIDQLLELRLSYGRRRT